MQVKEIMTTNPACCTPDSSLREIAQMMVEHDCGCIPVVENQQTRKPIGTVTDRDITIRAFTTGRNPLELQASDVMTMGITTVSPESSIQECADVMEDKKIRRVIVVDENGRCRGIVAQADIAEYGQDPTLISELVHEISEAESSPNKGVFNKTKSGQSFRVQPPMPPMPPSNRMKSGQSYQPNRTFEADQSYSTNRSYQKKKSVFSISSLLPLLVGVGISVGAKYFLDSNNENRRRETVKHQPKGFSGNLQASYDKSRGGLPNQAEDFTSETEKSKKVLNATFQDKKDNLNPDTEIGRTAGQS